jgi:transcriptional regulator with XRE-family HTH domain
MPGTAAANVRAELARRRITRTQLSEAVGMGRESLSRRLRDETDFTVTEITAIADYFGMPVCDLLEGAAS